MKRKILFLLFLLQVFLSLCTYAQLPTAFYGLRLGSSTESDVVRNLTGEGYNVDKPVNSNGLMSYVFDKKNFIEFGTSWNFAIACCDQNTLVNISFKSFFSNQSSAEYVYKHILKHLKDSYGDFIKQEEVNNITFKDSKITCMLYLSSIRDKTVLTLEFY